MRTVLVTGAGSGMGLECALHLAGLGDRVFGSVLNGSEAVALQAAASARGLAVVSLQMDVTRPDQIRAAVEEMLARVGRIDALVYFAGMGLRGFFEDLDMDEIKRVYDVNVFGAMSVVQAVLPSMREARSGRIVLTTSVAGRMGSMGISGYSSSKFATEGFAECLSLEVAPFGIQVSLLEPGLIFTPHFTVNRNRARRAVRPDSPYFRWFCQHEHIVDEILQKNKFTTADVAAVVASILASRRQKLRYLVGFKAQLVVALRRYSPFDWFERIYFHFLRRMVTSPRKQATGLSGAESAQEQPGRGYTV